MYGRTLVVTAVRQRSYLASVIETVPIRLSQTLHGLGVQVVGIVRDGLLNSLRVTMCRDAKPGSETEYAGPAIGWLDGAGTAFQDFPDCAAIGSEHAIQ